MHCTGRLRTERMVGIQSMVYCSHNQSHKKINVAKLVLVRLFAKENLTGGARGERHNHADWTEHGERRSQQGFFLMCFSVFILSYKRLLLESSSSTGGNFKVRSRGWRSDREPRHHIIGAPHQRHTTSTSHKHGNRGKAAKPTRVKKRRSSPSEHAFPVSKAKLKEYYVQAPLSMSVHGGHMPMDIATNSVITIAFIRGMVDDDFGSLALASP
jgi:hypothetical protein